MREFIFGLVNESSFLENIGDKGVRNLDDAREFILEGPWASHREQGYGQFLVELKESGDPVGVCGVLYREALDVSDIGCAFLPAYWRQGIAFEAACAVMEYGRTTLGIEKNRRADLETKYRLDQSVGKTGNEIREDGEDVGR